MSKEVMQVALDAINSGHILQLTRAVRELTAALALPDEPVVGIEELRKDVERLDFLDEQCEAYGFEDIHEGNRWLVEGPFKSIRVAIDEYLSHERKA